MTLIIALNAVFSAFVVFGIVALHAHAIAKSRAEQAGTHAGRVAAGGQVVTAAPSARRERERADVYGPSSAPARA